ncbi:hypothetical protein [Amycolatopsis sp. lyj-84]|uniref:hypothetical protein n=1 Tax=Amycolatopsis sp. lyj-84 TaxID=2789284 RepID=UPI00397BEA1D
MTSEEDLESLLADARKDRVGLSAAVAVARAKVGKGATFPETLEALLSVVSSLIDRGAVPGDLVAEDPGFVAWAGSKEEVLARLTCVLKALGELPVTGEVCWIHDPAVTA